jgi:lysophospholipase L1-like esterase
MRTFVSLLIALSATLALHGQIVYHNADAFPVLGKATTHTRARYERLPDSLETRIRPQLWDLSRNSAGLAIRFRTNSTTVAARWDAVFNNAMNHMTATGIKGLDLYALIDGEWRFVNSGRPQGKHNRATIIADMTPEMREYMLYLSLYDGVENLEIGVDSLSLLESPQVELPVRRAPIVAYGTSILQGGCATRAGMAHTNILMRQLNREIINLGFSGNGRLDYEVADVMAAVPDVSLYILDFVPNATVEQIRERTIPFYRILRRAHPDVPILFVENPRFPYALFDTEMAAQVANKNAALRDIYDQLRSEGEKHIRYLSSRDMIGRDGEATVDGQHFTDLGFVRYAALLEPIIKKLIKR